jgi:formate dehydrogenase subunit gamma
MAQQNDSVLRHAGIDRLFHWFMAATMIVLLATSLLPIIGVHFAWYSIHWMAGVLLTVIILLHIVRALFWQRPGTMLKLNSGDLSGL